MRLSLVAERASRRCGTHARAHLAPAVARSFTWPGLFGQRAPPMPPASAEARRGLRRAVAMRLHSRRGQRPLSSGSRAPA